ncbi:hypothetical protein F7642_12780 [Tenacibaculum finnmarkense genomovar ulcerans]|uniref:hypothetical protein n=2 Tax=Tenacibaculum finnmarkense TaxID=2781243 RepID=UPI00187B5418|nr:hypothetical protein [Tenacibaculum finnmarkense]MCD8436045.1 hypothetical protein [Tenacibaculum dicentrarchi]MBE7635194.1 hypothetical protein [Tenacibaculum finnmarkense genomovar ulcerans]MCD8431146.1 hypothetical protein [Tenacibaculum finnmarkense genomovar ulcerans]MCG8750535.1 hypothetical protein [Tenacibaculum finnmarkense]MCG8755504.1 hypothetical protein [Tenacibaculum finnmarkense]
MKKQFLIAIVTITVTLFAFKKPEHNKSSQFIQKEHILVKDCKIDNNLTKTVIDFIGSCVRGSVWEEIPDGQTGAYAKMTLGTIKKNRSKNNYKTVWKLISRAEYRK